MCWSTCIDAAYEASKILRTLVVKRERYQNEILRGGKGYS